MGVGGKGHAQAALPSGKASCKYVSASGTGYCDRYETLSQ